VSGLPHLKAEMIRLAHFAQVN